ncbi:hypothetical protein E2C01_058333 [Portunus trituberculatus]|uniref:Uncharacterized protein n=1 Tax=Portunus trituberculatus TaxID=210409 RepID=A0A5B7GZK6_PORTR|nr:hypothetical protein [Portunus trituberculatus]
MRPSSEEVKLVKRFEIQWRTNENPFRNTGNLEYQGVLRYSNGATWKFTSLPYHPSSSSSSPSSCSLSVLHLYESSLLAPLVPSSILIGLSFSRGERETRDSNDCDLVD